MIDLGPREIWYPPHLGARIHTERHEAMKAGRRVHEARECVEAELAQLHKAQAELAENYKATEHELEEL